MASAEIAKGNKMVCERCFKHNKLDMNASGYCSTCAKYFCPKCLDVHRDILPSHLLEEMPEYYTMQRCKVHDGEFLKFYCEQHDSFICNLCTKEDEHFLCRSLETISSLTMKLKSNNQYETFQDELSKILKSSTHLKREYEKKIAFLDIQNEDCVKSADSYAAQRVVEVSSDFLVVDDFEGVLMVKKELQNINEIERTAQQTLSEISDLPYELKERTCDMYIALKAASSTIKQCSRKLKKVPTPPNITAYRKEQQHVLLSIKEVFKRYVADICRATGTMLQNTTLKFFVCLLCLGIVLFCKTQHSNCSFEREHNCELCEPISKLRCERMTSYSDAIEKNENMSSMQTKRYIRPTLPILLKKTHLNLTFKNQAERKIRDLYVICRDQLLVTDDTLLSILVYDITGINTSYHTIQTGGKVGLIAKSGPNSFLVVIPEKNAIEYFSCVNEYPKIVSTSQLAYDSVLRKHIFSDKNIKNVLVHNDLCIFATHNEVYTIAMDSEERTLIYFSKIEDNHIAVAFGKWNSVIYVSDFKLNIVLKLTLEGDIIALFDKWRFYQPADIVVDRYGSSFVYDGSIVIAISPDLKDSNVLLVLYGQFASLTLLEKDDNKKLLIGNRESSDVVVLNLK